MMPTMDVFNANNKTILTSDKIGILPFGKVALTNDYRVEYTGMASVGKTVFTLIVTRLSDGQPVDNLSPALMPVMNMAEMRHDTPVGSVTNNNDGTYEFTIYYLMPNMMGGYWDLGVELDGTNTVHFYPTVMNPMDGSTPRVILKGLNGDDVIPTMLGDQPRPYFLFKESIADSTSAGKHDFSVFLAARETMTSHPAIDQNVILNQGDLAYELIVTSVNVEMYRQNGSSWTTIPVTNDGSGYFSATDIEGLTSSVDPDTGMAPIRVKLSINGVAKTTNGAAVVPDDNDYQTFNVILP